MGPEIRKIYGNRLRIRVCGICQDATGSFLMVNHKMLTKADFWAPPGGGVDFGLSVEEALKKEFMEETGLSVNVDDLLFVCEFLREPLHSIELFFKVSAEAGELIKGADPEMGNVPQIIDDVRFLSFEDIARIPPEEKHGIFNRIKSADDLKKMYGYVKLVD